MPQHVIEQIDSSISEVFALMLNRDCSPTQGSCTELVHHPEPAAGSQHVPALVASISFSGSMRGACSIHLPLRTAAAITGELVGPAPEDEAATLNADTAGEICNMIAGSWKSRQPNSHATCAISTPQVTCAISTSHVSQAQLAGATPDAQPSSSQPAFRNVLVRTYVFEDHCLHLQLGFD